MTEFKLSEKRQNHMGNCFYPEEDVKEFIEGVLSINQYIVSATERERRIKKLAGDVE